MKKTVVGFIYATEPARAITPRMLGEFPMVTDVKAEVAREWYSFTYTSYRPLRDEPPARGEYRYRIVCRVSDSRILLAASRRKIVRTFVHDVLEKSLGAQVYPIALRLDPIVRHLVMDGSTYALTFVAASSSTTNESLRKAHFWGDSVVNALSFVEFMKEAVATACGLRDSMKKDELLQIDNGGKVRLHVVGPARFQAIDDVFRTFRRLGVITVKDSHGDGPIGS